MTILVCDAGGTHIRYALSEDGRFISEPQKFKIAEFSNFESIVSHFLSGAQTPAEKITSFRLSYGDQNPWKITEEECSRFLPAADFLKVNDFEANAWGIATASEGEFLLLNKPYGVCSGGASKCVIGSGTGLGLAYISDRKGVPQIQRTHGGHMLPVTVTDDHRELFDKIQKLKQIPSVAIYEDILSGPGIFNIYKLLAGRTHTHADEYRDTNDMIDRGRNDPLAEQALRFYHEILGVFAHQAVAFGFSYQGLYLTGGITDRLVINNLFDFDTFEKFFIQDNIEIVKKDVGATPVFWVKNEFIALKGLLEIDS